MCLAFAFCLTACTVPPETTMLSLEHLNPAGMHRNPAFSQAVVVRGPHRVIHVGGQNAVDSHGTIVGRGDVAAQAAQVAANLKTVLQAAGASIEGVVKWNVHLVQGQPAGPAMQAFARVLGQPAKPAAITVLYVAALAHPDFLLEVDAVAVAPEP